MKNEPSRAGRVRMVRPGKPFLGLVAAMCLAGPPSMRAGLPAGDITLQPVVTANLPVFSSLTGYAYSNDNQVVSTTIGGTTVNYDSPLYYPYNAYTSQWWDNLVAEQNQGRLPVVFMPTRGAWTLTATDLTGPGDLNPRRLTQYIAALQRAGAASLFQIACFVDSPSMRENYNALYSLPGTGKMDLSNTAGWNDILWLRTVKPWFDTVPSAYWYRINNRPVIQFWGFHPVWFSNHYGNVSQMLTFLADEFEDEYGVRPWFIMPADMVTASNQDSTVAGQMDVLGLNSWFGPPSTPYTMTLFDGFTSGTVVPGFINPNVYNPSDPNYNSPNLIIRHNKVDGSGVNGDTFIAGMDAAVAANAQFTLIEGWNDVREWAGLYRALPSPRIDFASQYMNIARQYNDLRTVTLRLEAEGADDYSDTTTGNSSGTVFRRSGNLDVRFLGGGPAVTASSQNAPGQQAAYAFDGIISTRWVTTVNGPGWLQYDYGFGNSKTVAGYSLTSASDTPQRDPKDWQFQGSNDGSSWTTLDTRTGETFASRLLVKSYSFSNSTSYRYYRFNITANAGGAGYGLHLQEVVFSTVAEILASGWSVTNTAANEWVEFKKIYFSPGNYKFPIRYSAAAAGKRVRLVVDGTALSDVTLPATGGADVFDTISIGNRTMTWGAHTLRVVFVDGGVDLDWLFVRKTDSLTSLRAATNNNYVCAELGGGSTVVANKTAVGNFERFSINDTNGGSLTHNDVVSLQAYNGLYLCAEGGGGGVLAANRRRQGGWENFTVEKVGGTGTIGSGDAVAFRTQSGRYLTVGSGSVLNASATTVGTAQTFTVGLSAQ